MALHKNWRRAPRVVDMAVNGRKLGKTQVRVLRCLLEYGTYPGIWKWNTEGKTAEVLNSLVKHSLVVTEDLPRTDWRGNRLEGTTTYYRPAQWMRDAMDASTDEDATTLLEDMK